VKNILVVALVVVLLASAFPQEKKPAFSGTWEREARGARHSERVWDVYEIKLNDSKLDVLHRYEGPDQSFHFVLDGKLRTVSTTPRKIEGKAHWDGAVIVAERREVVGGKATQWTTRFILSDDGKQLTIRNQVKKPKPAPDFEQELVYQRK